VDLTPGTVLLGKYRIDELIGSGGMGNVVRASHLYLHQAVAIKILLPEMASSDSTKQRFLREAQATVKLRSEHSARVMDVGTTPEGLPFMVMEYLEGNDLNQILRHHGPQVPSIVVDLMLQACEGIAEAHALGIIHRDVKPSNFFITRRPDGSMLLKILDFGISKTSLDYGELTGTQTVIGTPSYMAPEQMKSGRSADPRSDIWSIGVVMYQLITGRPPFSGESYADLVLKVGLEPPAPMMVQLPNGLGEVILRCLEKDPRGRHQHVGDLARMLAPYATDPISAAQSAGRTMRILQQRGAQGQVGQQGSPLSAGGGLSTPIPISPAQLTPRSWPPSQGTSLSQGAGQMTMKTRGARGLLVAGVIGLCVVAGAGGYIVSQMRAPAAAPREPHVTAPAPTRPPIPTPDPAAAPAPSEAAAPSTASAPSTAAGPATAAPSTAAAPAAAAPSESAAPATAAPSTASGTPSAAPSSPSTAAASPATASSTTAAASPATASSTTAAASPATASSATAAASPPTAAASSATATTATATSPTATSRTASPTPTIVDAKAAAKPTTAPTGSGAKPADPAKPPEARRAAELAKPTDAKAAELARPTDGRPAKAAQLARPTDAKPAEPARPAKPSVETGPASDAKATKPASDAKAAKPASDAKAAKPASEPKPTKPATRTTKPRSDDLFDSRH
jgi:serine/threonine-protein kinase